MITPATIQAALAVLALVFFGAMVATGTRNAAIVWTLVAVLAAIVYYWL